MNAGLQIDVAFLGWAVCMEFRMEMAFLMNLEKNSLLQTFLNGVTIGLLVYEWVPEYFFLLSTWSYLLWSLNMTVKIFFYTRTVLESTFLTHFPPLFSDVSMLLSKDTKGLYEACPINNSLAVVWDSLSYRPRSLWSVCRIAWNFFQTNTVLLLKSTKLKNITCYPRLRLLESLIQCGP